MSSPRTTAAPRGAGRRQQLRGFHCMRRLEKHLPADAAGRSGQLRRLPAVRPPVAQRRRGRGRSRATSPSDCAAAPGPVLIGHVVSTCGHTATLRRVAARPPGCPGPAGPAPGGVTRTPTSPGWRLRPQLQTLAEAATRDHVLRELDNADPGDPAPEAAARSWSSGPATPAPAAAQCSWSPRGRPPTTRGGPRMRWVWSTRPAGPAELRAPGRGAMECCAAAGQVKLGAVGEATEDKVRLSDHGRSRPTPWLVHQRHPGR
jgi:hypothetical protein